MPVDAATILAALPQTQCTRCGYPDCADYAQAISQGRAPINQCPPGGAQGIERLAAITGMPVQPLNPENGAEAPRVVVYIDEAWCIGCTLCIKACPVDAIVGANKLMHSVIESACTGCELCIPACPVDCIIVENASADATGWSAWSAEQADMARDRYQATQCRRHDAHARDPALQAHAGQDVAPAAGRPDATAENRQQSDKRQIIAAAQARAKARQSTR